MIGLSTGEVDGAHPSQISTRHSDGIRVGVDTDQKHSDNNSMTKVARPLDDNPKAPQLR